MRGPRDAPVVRLGSWAPPPPAPGRHVQVRGRVRESRGMTELHALGVLPRLPRMLGTQAEGAAPLVRAFDAATRTFAWTPTEASVRPETGSRPRSEPLPQVWDRPGPGITSASSTLRVRELFGIIER